MDAGERSALAEKMTEPIAAPHSRTTMHQPLVIHFAGITRSIALENAIRAHVHRLEQHVHDLMACRVAIFKEAHGTSAGGLFSARVSVVVPGREIVVSNMHDGDVYCAVRDAFDSIGRRLEDDAQFFRQQRRESAAPAARGLG